MEYPQIRKRSLFYRKIVEKLWAYPTGKEGYFVQEIDSHLSVLKKSVRVIDFGFPSDTNKKNREERRMRPCQKKRLRVLGEQ